MLIYAELKYKKYSTRYNLLIGLLAGLTILLKQSTGIIISAITVIYLLVEKRDKQTIKAILYRVCGVLIPCIILLIYLLATSSMSSFIDYCILGIGTFKNSISYLKLLRGGDLTAIFGMIVPFTLVVLLVINIINIIVLFVIVKSLAYKPVKNFLDARKARIDESLKNAENKNAEADALKAQYEDALKQSKQESDKIMGEAELSAQKRAAEITADADKKATDITEKARKDAEREYNERLAGLRADVTDIAFDISKKILSREVTDADNMAIADEFFSKYGEKEEKV